MSDVRRYAMVDRGFDDYQMMPVEGGGWVDGDDHDAAIAAKDAEIERLRAALRKIESRAKRCANRYLYWGDEAYQFVILAADALAAAETGAEHE